MAEAAFIEGLIDTQLQEMFRAARDADYQAAAEEARAIARQLPKKGAVPEGKRAPLRTQLARVQKRVAEIAALDFFEAQPRTPRRSAPRAGTTAGRRV